MNLNDLADLHHWTEQTDPIAEDAARAIMTGGRDGIEKMSTCLKLLSNVPPADPWPPELTAFVAATPVPPGVDWDRVRKAQQWFDAWGVLGATSLFCASLPETYCLPGIARLLMISGQLKDHATRRIKMTGQMLFNVMTPGRFDETLAGRSLRRTRLMHAALRTMLLDQSRAISSRADLPANRDANLVFSAEFGKPINQIELVYTLMTFSHIVLRSFKAFGVPMDAELEDAYVYAWNTAGRMLGIHDDLLPANAAEAETLFERIKKGAALSTADMPQLIEALEASWHKYLAAHLVPFSRPLMHAMFETLLPPDTRQLLNIQLAEGAAEAVIEVLGSAVEVGTDVYGAAIRPRLIAHIVGTLILQTALHETDISDRGLWDTRKHMEAWFEQVTPLMPSKS